MQVPIPYFYLILYFITSMTLHLPPLLAQNRVKAQQKTIHMQTDILVIGGSTSGTGAGIAAAREGVKTLIIEESPWLGGMFTTQGVGAADGNQHLQSGIWQEFRQALADHYGGFDKLATGWVSNTLFEPHIGDRIFKSIAAKEPLLTVKYGYYLERVIKENKQVRGAIFSNIHNTEKLIVSARITIDATDIGESLRSAGAAYRLGMDAQADTQEKNAPIHANNIIQDLTWVAILKDYGPSVDKTIAQPKGYKAEEFTHSCAETVDRIKIDCQRMLSYGQLPNNKYMINWPKHGNDIYLNVIELDRKNRMRALQEAKDQTLRFIYFIQHELGYRNLGLADDEFDSPDRLAYAPYHREGRRLKGMAFLTYPDIEKPYEQPHALYRTGIAVGDYPVDHHHDKNPAAPKLTFPPIPSFTIPLGALIPEKIEGLIVSDKAISVSNLINGSTRLQPVVLLTGQAAGLLAAISVKDDKQPRSVSIREVQARLLQHKAYLLPLYDVKPNDPDFEIIQKVAATGILKTIGESWHWANRTWFYPDSTVTIADFTAGLHAFDPNNKVIDSVSPLTYGQALHLLQATDSEAILQASSKPNSPITRRELARLVDQRLKPFAKPIDYYGNYIN